MKYSLPQILSRIYLSFFLLICVSSSNLIFTQTLKIATFNVWSGLDYEGFSKVGEYESEQTREKRFLLFLEQLKSEKPDIIFLQEVNPAGEFSERLADSLGYSEVHHVCNAGLKLFNIGVPSNLNEGIAILARPELKLEKHDIWKLSGSTGLNGDYINFHFDNSEYTLTCKIILNNVMFYLVNVHLFAAVNPDSLLYYQLDSLYHNKQITRTEYIDIKEKWEDGVQRQLKETNSLINKLKEFSSEHPVIVAGDFNSNPYSKIIKKMKDKGNLYDTYLNNYSYTWDPSENINYRLQRNRNNNKNAINDLTLSYDDKPRTIDYILLNNKFKPDDIKNTKIVYNNIINGVQASDHYGLLSTIDVTDVTKNSQKETDKVPAPKDYSIDPLPILSYDSDAGFGYGAKGFALNLIGIKESFDLILFNSSKGERWYKLVFSAPDFDLRQFRKYPLSFDVDIDYDKMISANFFGIGSSSSYENNNKYTKEAIDISMTIGRAITREFITQLGIKYKTVKNFNFEDTERLRSEYAANILPEKSSNLSFYLNLRFDTRNSFINPSHGSVIQLESEISPKIKFNDVKFQRISLWLQKYYTIAYPKTIIALRFGLSSLFGNNIPIQNLLSLGGNRTLRGSSKDRYLDKSFALINAELRFPIYWRFSGIAGIDAGKVWSSLSKFDLKKWVINPAFGFRLDMNTFIARLDAGFGKDNIGIYFNFGQIF